MWPHVRPWHLANPQPMLRGVADAQKVAAILARALIDADPTRAGQVQAATPAAGHDLSSGSSVTRASVAA